MAGGNAVMTAPATATAIADDLHQRRASAIAQQDTVVATAAPRAVLACPGAGKTRTIVERHCTTPRNQPTGRAITSFTKVAAAQIRARAHELNRPDLLQHPNAIMTLDGFFWRFLVRPFLPPPDTANQRPFRRLESWRDAPRQLRQIEYWSDKTRQQFDLADFQFRYPGGNSAPIATLTGSPRFEGGRRHLSDDQIAAVCRLAEQRRTELANTHRLFTGEEVRRQAGVNLATRKELLAHTLPTRFTELIIDEAQDCSDVDVDILQGIQLLGLPTLIIGDPDQAIYGFRNPGPPAITRLLHHAETIELTGNWRSSTTICHLAATLRTDPHRHVPDNALADHHDSDLPVHLIALNKGKELAAFDTIATNADIAPADRLILAHGAATLPGLGGRARRPPSNPVESLIWAVGVLRQPPSDQRTRALAEQTLQATLVRYWMPDADSTAASDRHAVYGIDPHHLRRLAATALHELPELSLPAADWCAAARRTFDTLPPTPGRTTPAGIAITSPRGKGTKPASAVAKLPATPRGLPTTRADTVHQVKGEEADAVLMLVPDEDRTTRMLTLWIEGIARPTHTNSTSPDTAEALRVLYVAVTRAQRLVALALPAAHIPEVARHLTNRNVPINVTA
ncbi:UvrD-helicase domain-containing protein [Micromonospora arborensis]|uniref:UvrD-helicase domain-containing protein n=1 Tax=Micromonospora arborensis TaxID=2116518 RepID=UPI0033DC28F6